MGSLGKFFPIGASPSEVLTILRADGSSRLFASALLASAASSHIPSTIQMSGEAAETRSRDGHAVLYVEAANGAHSADVSGMVTLILSGDDGGLIRVYPMGPRPYLPVTLDTLAMLVAEADHVDSLLLHPADLRLERFAYLEEVLRIPATVVAAFMGLAAREL